MRSHNNLYERICSFANLLAASRKARKGKRSKESCRIFERDLEKELVTLQRELLEMRYRHGPYKHFLIFDPKCRLISGAPYRDRVVHHALCNVIEPLFDQSFIYDTYACRRGKGVHKAVDRYTAFARKYRYVLKCDIRKYFHLVDQQILKEILFRKISCRPTRWLIGEIIGSYQSVEHGYYFRGDNLFSVAERRRGIPIGNLTSQFFANVYLDAFDHFVKERLRLPYIRYVDDFVLFSDSARELEEARSRIEERLAGLRLLLHKNKSRVYRVQDGVRFLGYRIFPEYRRLDRRNVLQMKRKLKKMAKDYRENQVELSTIHQSIQSWIGHAAHADTWCLRERVLGGVVFQRGSAEAAAGRFVEQRSY